MNQKYRVRYTRKNTTGASMPCTQDVYGVSAIGALNAFHRSLQLSRELDSNKNELRPKLTPEDYSIVSIALVYNTDATGKGRGEWIESAFDLPVGARNPDVRPKPVQGEQEPMPFMAGLAEGRLAE